MLPKIYTGSAKEVSVRGDHAIGAVLGSNGPARSGLRSIAECTRVRHAGYIHHRFIKRDVAILDDPQVGYMKSRICSTADRSTRCEDWCTKREKSSSNRPAIPSMLKFAWA
jgi:hypothetical protein